jgi:PAS domain-containing protein
MARDRQWNISGNEVFSLFENASEAIVSFRPGEGQIIEVNAQTERLIGRPRGEILSLAFINLFDETHREQVSWLVAQPGGRAKYASKYGRAPR